jgi:hypothetical protein
MTARPTKEKKKRNASLNKKKSEDLYQIRLIKTFKLKNVSKKILKLKKKIFFKKKFRNNIKL